MAPMAQYGTAGDKKQPENKKNGSSFRRWLPKKVCSGSHWPWQVGGAVTLWVWVTWNPHDSRVLVSKLGFSVAFYCGLSLKKGDTGYLGMPENRIYPQISLYSEKWWSTVGFARRRSWEPRILWDISWIYGRSTSRSIPGQGCQMSWNPNIKGCLKQCWWWFPNMGKWCQRVWPWHIWDSMIIL